MIVRGGLGGWSVDEKKGNREGELSNPGTRSLRKKIIKKKTRGGEARSSSRAGKEEKPKVGHLRGGPLTELEGR